MSGNIDNFYTNVSVIFKKLELEPSGSKYTDCNLLE